MKIILNPSNLIDILQNEGIEAVPKSELQELKDELIDLGGDVSLEETNLGRGADWIVILAIVNSIANVFLV